VPSTPLADTEDNALEVGIRGNLFNEITGDVDPWNETAPEMPWHNDNVTDKF